MTTDRSKRQRIIKHHALALALVALVLTGAGFADGLSSRQPRTDAQSVEPDAVAQMHLLLGRRGMAEFFPPR